MNLKNQVVNRFLIVLIHIVGWVTFISSPFIFLGSQMASNENGPPRLENFRLPAEGELALPQSDFDINALWIQSIVFNIPLIIFFYFNVYVLIPGVLRRKSWMHYFGLIVFCFGSIFLASELIDQILLFSGAFHPGRPFYFTTLNFLLVFGLSSALRLTGDRIQFERERKESENENLKSELALLRSQISPHFMFIVLNNLASLDRKKSHLLESVIIQLSRLMRYMLYESGEKRVRLDTEIEYLKSYINLQKLRFGNDISINFDTPVTKEDLPIEPMLLIPFVENAFKHGIGLITNPMIMITLSVDDHVLNFVVKNRFNASHAYLKDLSSGIGIQSVRRRLDLLYKHLYELNIYESDKWFIVKLKLILR